MTPVSICLDVSEPLRQRLHYGATELLRPLALRPALVGAGDLPDGGVYVGPSPEAQAEGVLAFRHRELTAAALLSERPLAADEVGRADDLPLPFPLGARGPLAVETVEPFASAFWWLSGVQERAETRRDRWGRVPYAASLQSALGTPLATPVDALRDWIAGALRARGHAVARPAWAGAPWAFSLTHDLDATRTRRLRAALGDAARGRPLAGLRRGLGPDARRRSAEALVQLAREAGVQSTIFAKAGESGREDVRAEPERDAAWLRSLVGDGFEVGLHPSMEAATDGARLERETRRLEAAVGRPLAAVRSHYLRWDPAVTPALYAGAGFALDSTLGWSEQPGFRRGTAHPFHLWDAVAGRPSPLVEAPLAVMDTTLFEHQGLSLTDATASLLDVLRVARASGGLAVVLWHNAMRDEGLWRQRLPALEAALRFALDDGAAVLPLSEAVACAI